MQLREQKLIECFTDFVRSDTVEAIKRVNCKTNKTVSRGRHENQLKLLNSVLMTLKALLVSEWKQEQFDNAIGQLCKFLICIHRTSSVSMSLLRQSPLCWLLRIKPVELGSICYTAKGGARNALARKITKMQAWKEDCTALERKEKDMVNRWSPSLLTVTSSQHGRLKTVPKERRFLCAKNVRAALDYFQRFCFDPLRERWLQQSGLLLPKKPSLGHTFTEKEWAPLANVSFGSFNSLVHCDAVRQPMECLRPPNKATLESIQTAIRERIKQWTQSGGRHAENSGYI